MLADLAAEGTTLPPANSGTGAGTADSNGYPVAAVKLQSPSENPSDGAATPELRSVGGDYTREHNVVQGPGQASTGSVPPDILKKVRFIASESLVLLRSSASSAAQIEGYLHGASNIVSILGLLRVIQVKISSYIHNVYSTRN